MKRYSPKEIEPKWQKKWEDEGIYQATEDPDKPKRYVLEYFPYPSGAAMHVGHVRNYAIGDAIARFYRRQGYNVMHPMGWDSFGLPAENYAIKNNISPKQAIAENTTKFKQQLTQMGFSYDWSREIDSSDPSYYKWTQWFFKLLFERGLAYQKDSLQWWCETDKTVLANEQVEAGKCWRCGNEVVKKPLKQWFFKITDYADRLVDDLEDLDWSEGIKTMQRNWIGKSIGAEVDFAVDGHNNTKITVFTTRPDTLFGATFMVMAPEHPLVNDITSEDQKEAVNSYVKQAQSKSDIERQETDREKTGVFTGAYAVNPVNGEKIPVWIADYVLFGYGTGAIMAVPAHDERDYEFAQKFNLPRKQVVANRFIHKDNNHRDNKTTVERNVVCLVVKHPNGDKYLINKPKGSEFWAPVMGGIEKDETIEEATKRELLEESGYHDIKNLKVFDPVIASEFYAQHKGENRIAYIKVVLVELASLNTLEVSEYEKDKQELKWVSTDEAKALCLGAGAQEIYSMAEGYELPMAYEGRLINSVQYDGLLTSDAREIIVKDLASKKLAEEKVNYKIRDWLISRQRYWGAPIPIIHCDDHGPVAVPDEQLPVELPEVKDYRPTGKGSALASASDWLNTTCPKCGKPAKRETDTMDGFACSSWYFLRFADPHNDKEAFSNEKAKFWLPVDDYIGGAEHAVMHLLYARMWTKVMYDAGLVEFNEPFKALRNQGMILAPDGRKMSKSWGNVISPDELIDQGYGADSIRVMELFIGPWNQQANWSVEGMGGCFRFLQRVWTLCQEFLESPQDAMPEDNASSSRQINVISHKTIEKVSRDLNNMDFNTAISALMEMTNVLYKVKAEDSFADKQTWTFAIETLVQLLAVFAPHMTEELWEQLGHSESIHISSWPVHDEAYLVDEQITIVVQVNGKVRGEIQIASDASEEEVMVQAKAHEKVASYIEGNKLKKEIYIKGRLVSFVV